MRPTTPSPPEGTGSATATLQEPWWVYHGTGESSGAAGRSAPWLPGAGGPAPSVPAEADDGARFSREMAVPAHLVDWEEVSRVNAALLLHRPLLVTADDGLDASVLAYRISRELGLGRVLRWQVTESSTLAEGEYVYDALGHFRTVALHWARLVRDGAADPEPHAADFIRLGPLGTALLPSRIPRVLLIEEIDRAESDLPDSLAAALHDGCFTVKELAAAGDRPQAARIATDDGRTAALRGGRVRCDAFPVTVITSIGARDLPASFTRGCVGVHLAAATVERLTALAEKSPVDLPEHGRDIREALLRRAAATEGDCTRRLLDALNLAAAGAVGRAAPGSVGWETVLDAIWRWTAAPQ